MGGWNMLFYLKNNMTYIKLILLLFSFLISTTLISQENVNQQLSLLKSSGELTDLTLIARSATKRVLVPHKDIGKAWWQNIDFDDTAWTLCEGAPGGVGYEINTGYENLISLDVGAEMHVDGGNPNPGCYIRIPFTVTSTDLTKILFLQLRLRYDDGFKAYLNGKKVAIANAPQLEHWNSFATEDHEADAVTIFDITNYIDYLLIGKNVLAIHGMNVSNQSSDFLIMAELVASDNLYGDFDSSNMPIFLINTNGQPIPDEPKIDAEMKIIYNGPGEINHPTDTATEYNGKIGIEIRGAYSSTFPQKPYGMETRDESGNNLNVSLLGMPEENDWALITNYNEKSFVRNTLAFDLSREIGHYAPRAQLCEVFVNSVYQGIYVFTEKIKRDKNRVDIAKLRPVENAGDDLTGGYIIKVDYFNASDSWLSSYRPMGHPDQRVHFVYYYPDANEITFEQKKYIQEFIEATEGALYGSNFTDPHTGYRKYMDVASFIDYFIVSEVSRNVDGYKKSRFFYKDKDSKDGLLHAGPVWDFDWAWKNIGSGVFSASDGSGWGYKTNDYNPDINPPGWYFRLLQDGNFTNRLINRYFELRSNVLDFHKINAYIDSVKTYIDNAQQRHFELWPIDKGYIAPEPGPPSRSYEEEITKLKTWIRRRLNWLDANIPDLRNEITVGVSTFNQNTHKSANYQLYPNPATDFLIIESEMPIKQVKIFNVIGQQVFDSEFSNPYLEKIQIDGFRSGLYFMRLIRQDGYTIVRKHIFIK